MKWLLGLIGGSPYMILGIAVVLIAVAGGSFYGGWHEKSLRVDAANEAQEQLIVKQYTMGAVVLQQVSQDTEKQLSEIQIVHDIVEKQVDKIVTRTLYNNVCFDDDGVRLINQAIANKATPDPSGPNTKLQVTIHATGRTGSDGAARLP